MKIAIISDIHDNLESLQACFDKINKNKEILQVICLGDVCSPFTFKMFDDLEIKSFFVFGNNDGDRGVIMRDFSNKSKMEFSGREWGELKVDDKIYFCTHFPELALNAVETNKYDAVFYGHTHKKEYKIINGTPIINPGKLAIYPQDILFSFAIFDTSSNSVEFIEF